MSEITDFNATEQLINERSSARYRATFRDVAGNQIAGTSITGIVATLTDMRNSAIINGRQDQNVLNANGGTLTAEGVFTLLLSASDTIAAGTARTQRRRLTLEVTYDAGTLTHKVYMYIRALTDVTD